MVMGGPRNRTFLEGASVVVTWWIVLVLLSDSAPLNRQGSDTVLGECPDN